MGLLQTISNYASHIKDHTPIHYVPSFNDMNSNSNDDLDEMIQEEHQDVGVAARVPDAPAAARSMSNKADPDWPAFEGADIHRVNVADHTRDKRRMMDVSQNANRGPSVWEYIIKSENLKSTSFKSMDRDRDGALAASDLASTLHVDQSTAQRMVSEADTNKDGKISQDEYKSILEHYGSE